MILRDESKQISLYCRCLGIYLVFPILGAISIGALGSLLKVLALLPVGVWLLTRHRVKINVYFLVSILYVAWCALSLLWSVEIGNTLGRIMTQCSFLLLLASVMGYRFSAKELRYLKTCLIWSSRVTAVLVLVFADYLNGRIFFDGLIQEDPNYLCVYFVFALVEDISILLSTNKGQIKTKLCAVLEMALYAYISLGTGSRGGMLAVLASAFIMFAFYKEDGHSIRETLIKKLGIVLLVMVAVACIVPFVPENIIGRFSIKEILASKGSGRYVIWSDGLRAFWESGFVRKLLGYGTATVLKIGELFEFARHSVMHNIFIETLIELGIVGLCLYVCHVFSFLHMAIKRKDLFSVASISGMIVLSVSLSLYAFKPYWNIMIYILCTGNVLTNISREESLQCEECS